MDKKGSDIHVYTSKETVVQISCQAPLVMSNDQSETRHLHTCAVRNYSSRFARSVIDEVAEPNEEE